MSRRIAALAELVPRCSCLADIGCDHGELSEAVLSNGTADRVIAADISAPSLAKARALLGGTDQASFRCGDGLSILKPGEADVIVIAGMGGREIDRILRQSPDVADTARFILLGPHRNAEQVRHFLRSNGYAIRAERVVMERARFYPLMLAVHGIDGETDPFWNYAARGSLNDPDYCSYLQELLRRTNVAADGLRGCRREPDRAARLQEYADRIRVLLNL